MGGRGASLSLESRSWAQFIDSGVCPWCTRTPKRVVMITMHYRHLPPPPTAATGERRVCSPHAKDALVSHYPLVVQKRLILPGAKIFTMVFFSGASPQPTSFINTRGSHDPILAAMQLLLLYCCLCLMYQRIITGSDRSIICQASHTTNVCRNTMMSTMTSTPKRPIDRCLGEGRVAANTGKSTPNKANSRTHPPTNTEVTSTTRDTPLTMVEHRQPKQQQKQ